MKKILNLSAILLVLVSTLFFAFKSEYIAVKTKKAEENTGLKSGDIVFQSTDSRQCQAVKLATQSSFSHCGIIEIHKGNTWVIEAVQPVQRIPFAQWVSRNDSSHYEVRRIENLPDSTAEKIIQWAKNQLGKNYDLKFHWSDKEMYCSELVYKAYLQAGNIKLCELNPLKSYSLNHPEVRKIMSERYGNPIPWDEPMVAPQDLYDSPLVK